MKAARQWIFEIRDGATDLVGARGSRETVELDHSREPAS